MLGEPLDIFRSLRKIHCRVFGIGHRGIGGGVPRLGGTVEIEIIFRRLIAVGDRRRHVVEKHAVGGIGDGLRILHLFDPAPLLFGIVVEQAIGEIVVV